MAEKKIEKVVIDGGAILLKLILSIIEQSIEQFLINNV